MYKNGYYKVNDKIFTNKISALIYATEHNTGLEYCYYDEIFNKFNKKTLGQISLNDWYKLRAQQLRDNYDYLILNYSGGSDSHNILMTFLKNNIKLDCIFVQWHLKFTDKGLYEVNSLDKSNFNFHSEWDLVLKKDLEWISKEHPEIKIEIKDWTETIDNKFYTDSLFDTSSPLMLNISRSLKLHTFSSIETKLSEKGIKVGSIYGVAKPGIIIKDNKCFFSFSDKSFSAIPNPNNPDGLEYFYMTPDMPQLTIEQGWHILNFFKKTPELQYLIQARSQRKEPDYKQWPLSRYYEELEIYCEIVKKVCYPYWDFSRFQAIKPRSLIEFKLPKGFKPWDNILLKHELFSKSGTIWNYHWNSYEKLINKNFIRDGEIINLHSRWHFLVDL